jgi:hypothetical protein
VAARRCWTMTTLKRGRWKRRASFAARSPAGQAPWRIKARTPNPDLRIFDPAIDGQLKAEVADRAPFASIGAWRDSNA